MSSSTTSTAFAPRLLWNAYVEYLWNYQPNSWVGRTASFFRVLAIILVLPVLLLTLLDVASYVIARTLGIVDDVKASTSDTDPPISVNVPPPPLGSLPTHDHDREIQSSLAGESEDLDPEDSTHGRRRFESQFQMQNLIQGQIPTRNDSWTSHSSERAGVALPSSGSNLRPPERYYFEGEVGLRLAGVGELSPAASMPPSPLVPRTKLRTLDSDGTEGVVEMGEVNEDEGIVLRRRLQGARKGE